MKRIALLGAAGVIGFGVGADLAAAQTVTPNPPGTAGATPGHSGAATRAAPRSSAVQSLDAEAGTVSASGAPIRRRKFVGDGGVAGIVTGRGTEATAGAAAGASSSGSRTTSGVTSAGGSSSGAAASSSAAAGRAVTSVTSGVSGSVTAGGSSAGASGGGNSGKGGKGGGKK